MRHTVNRIASVSIVIALAAGLAIPAAALGEVVPPSPLEQPQPDPPTNRFGMPIEGWAVVRYSVLADGTTADVRVIDVMPEQLPERNFREAVERWVFAPATSDGSAVAWYNNESVIVIDAEQVPFDPSPMFVRGYREIAALMDEGEYEDALRSSRRLLATGTSRLAEAGVGLVQNSQIHLALGDYIAAYAAVRRATDRRLSLLQPSELVVALEYRNRLEIRLGAYVAALETFARRKELGPVPEDDVMAQNAKSIEAGLAGDAAIAVEGRMIGDVWLHDLSRRTFAIGDLEGDLKSVRIECDLREAEFEYSIESEWSVPESWGDCTVLVTGRGDTEFALYEFR